MSKIGIFILLVILSITILPESVSAQPPLGDMNPEQAPIDGGLGILAAAGGAYALKKLKEHQKK